MAAGAVEVVDDEKHRTALEGRRREAARSIEKKRPRAREKLFTCGFYFHKEVV
jgi:hypothetical protein